MKNWFSIGEMAKLHNTTIKTLRYYDKIGLLKPMEVNENNGYRYYSIEQFEQLNIINYLKNLGFSLKEIKLHLDTRDIDAFLELLEKQKEITEKKIKELQRIHNRFQNRIEDINKTRRIKELEVILIKKIQERKIVRLNEVILSECELEVSLRKLENMSNMSSSIFIGRVGLTIGIRNINSIKFDEYNSIFILLEDDHINNELVSSFPYCYYVCIYYRGKHTDSPRYYKMLLNYIKENNLEIIGDSIERTIIDHYISTNPDDYITELQIPVRSLTLPLG